MGSVLGYEYYFILVHQIDSLFALLEEYYDLNYKITMSHFQALGNPFVARRTMFFHPRCEQCSPPDSFALLC